MGIEIPRIELDGGPPKPDFYELMIGRALTPEELIKLQERDLSFKVEDFGKDLGEIIDKIEELKDLYPEMIYQESHILGISMVQVTDLNGRFVFFIEDHGLDMYKREITDD